MSITKCHSHVEDLPDQYKKLLTTKIPLHVTFFAKNTSRGFAVIMLLIVSIPFVVFLGHVLSGLMRGVAILKEDVISFLVVVPPILYFAVRYVKKEFWRHRLQAVNLQNIGVFFTDKALLWRVDEKNAHLIAREDLTLVTVKAKAVFRGRRYTYVVDCIELIAGTWVVCVTDDGDYPVKDIVAFIKSWRPDAQIKIDGRLEMKF